MRDLSAASTSGLSPDRKLTEVINRLAHAGFGDVFNEETTNPKSLPVVQIGEQKYRVSDVEEDRLSLRKDNEDDPLGMLPSRESKSQPASVKSTENSSQKQDSKNDEAKSGPSQSSGVHPGLVIFLNPINSREFLEKLPTSLRSFIQDTVKIIKQKSADGSTQFRFSFSELKLDISFENDSQGMKIRISSEEGTLRSSLFSKENQALLHNVLQKEFPDDAVQVIFNDGGQSATAMAFSQSGGGNGSQHEQTDADEDDNEK